MRWRWFSHIHFEGEAREVYMAKPPTQSCITNLYHMNGFVYQIRGTEVSQHTPVIELGGQCLSDLLRPPFSVVLVIYSAQNLKSRFLRKLL